MNRLGSLVVFAALVAAAPSLAQDTPPPPAPQPGGEQQPGNEDGERERRREERRRNNRFGGMNLPVEQLTEELGLTPEQVQQLEALNDEIREKGRTLMREAFQSGDPQAARAKIQGMFEETFGKLEGFLTPEQKEKAKGLRERLTERMRNRFERGGREGRGGRGGFGRENSRARLKEQAIEALALSEEEAAVVTPLLDACLETRELLVQEGERRRQEFLQKARETSEPEALGKLLEEFRAAREADQAQGRQAMDQLREVLTVEQEAKLVGLGVLD